MTKAELRKEILCIRSQLSPEERRQKSAAIGARLFGLNEFQAAGKVLFFVNFGSEVETLPMIEEALLQGKLVVAPKVKSRQGEMELRRLDDPQTQLQPGIMGIPEPDETCPPVALEEIHLIIVPAVAWDEKGYRVGYGGGFYDRLLARAQGIPKAGIAFECQVIAEVPHTGHDLSVDLLITEKRTLRFK